MMRPTEQASLLFSELADNSGEETLYGALDVCCHQEMPTPIKKGSKKVAPAAKRSETKKTAVTGEKSSKK